MTFESNDIALKRIADALGVPVGAFFNERLESGAVLKIEAQKQVSELIAAFAQITDTHVRRKCIEYVRSQHGKSSS